MYGSQIITGGRISSSGLRLSIEYGGGGGTTTPLRDLQ